MLSLPLALAAGYASPGPTTRQQGLEAGPKGISKPQARWQVRVVSAAPCLTYRHLRDRRRNWIVVVELTVRYQGSREAVARPRAALVVSPDREVGELRTVACRGGDDRCIANMAWLDGRQSGAQTRSLAPGEVLANETLWYWFEVPKNERSLQLRFADAPPIPLQLGKESCP